MNPTQEQGNLSAYYVRTYFAPEYLNYQTLVKLQSFTHANQVELS
jgi:hypothetical protein